MAVTLVFRCGCDPVAIDPDKTPTPRCACGETQIARVLQAQRPRFTGHAHGPLVQTLKLGPMAVNVAADGPLTLRTDDGTTARP